MCWPRRAPSSPRISTPFLLIAGGGGITPMMAICKSALAQGTGRVTLIYANRDEKSVIFAGALRALAPPSPTGSRSCTG
jgi:3-ketosteroid 9alpha-monooxygenase subunit B